MVWILIMYTFGSKVNFNTSDKKKTERKKERKIKTKRLSHCCSWSWLVWGHKQTMMSFLIVNKHTKNVCLLQLYWELPHFLGIQNDFDSFNMGTQWNSNFALSSQWLGLGTAYFIAFSPFHWNMYGHSFLLFLSVDLVALPSLLVVNFLCKGVYD